MYGVEPGSALEKKLRALFVKGNSNAAQQFNEFLQEGDLHSAYALAHTIKTSALLINKTTLSDISTQLEHLLKNKEQLPPELCNQFAQEMAAVLAELIQD